MRRILLILTFLALAASACGTESTTTTTTTTTAGEAEAEAIDAPARLAEPEPTAPADPCDGLRALLLDLDAVLEAGDAVYAARLTDAVEPLDTDAAASIATLVELDGDTHNDEQALGLIGDLDAVTYAACEIPAISAGIILSSQSVIARFCPVGESIGESAEYGTPEEPCPPPPPPMPSVLPCFNETGVPFLVDPLDAYEAVDCESRDLVRWDADDGAWIPDDLESVEQTFAEIDSAIG